MALNGSKGPHIKFCENLVSETADTPQDITKDTRDDRRLQTWYKKWLEISNMVQKKVRDSRQAAGESVRDCEHAIEVVGDWVHALGDSY